MKSSPPARCNPKHRNHLKTKEPPAGERFQAAAPARARPPRSRIGWAMLACYHYTFVQIQVSALPNKALPSPTFWASRDSAQEMNEVVGA
jgi:hypothetical protein